MEIISKLIKQKYIQILICLFILELVMSFQVKAYYLYFFKKSSFEIIETSIQLSYFEKTMNYLLENTDNNNILVRNLMQPSHFLMRIIPCDNEITKILILPSSFERINLYGTNIKGCYMIETYFFNDDQIQNNMRALFENIKEKQNKQLDTTYNIVININKNHYQWINFIKILNFEIQSGTLELQDLKRIDSNDAAWIKWIKKKTIFSWQSITIFILVRSIKFYYLIKWIFIK
jgi:hypothetical protein